MARIVTEYDFTLEVGDDTFTGQFRELDNSEAKKLEKSIKKQGLDSEETYRLALEKRVISPQKNDIMEVGKKWGYELTFKTILLDIRDNLKKKEEGF